MKFTEEDLELFINEKLRQFFENIYLDVEKEGYLRAKHIHHFYSVGVDLYTILSEYLQIEKIEITEMVTQGKITFEIFDKSLKLYNQ